ncbi:MAG: hypothetical protein OEL89_00745 [Candidatus Peregrinibacteria bacterium]|nr:hypothetical protein [Candidatus Peregrinibacteria bacterium]
MKCYFCKFKELDPTNDVCESCIDGSEYVPKGSNPKIKKVINTTGAFEYGS